MTKAGRTIEVEESLASPSRKEILRGLSLTLAAQDDAKKISFSLAAERSLRRAFASTFEDASEALAPLSF